MTHIIYFSTGSWESESVKLGLAEMAKYFWQNHMSPSLDSIITVGVNREKVWSKKQLNKARDYYDWLLNPEEEYVREA